MGEGLSRGYLNAGSSIVWAIALVLCLASLSARADTCELANYARLSTRALKAAKTTAMVTGKTLLFTAKTLEYPFWFLGHAGVLGFQAARSKKPGQAFLHIPSKIVQRDHVSMAIYATFYGIGRATMLTLYEMDAATGAGQEKEDDLIVYVNGFSPHDDGIFHDAAESYLEARHGKRKKSIGVVASSLEDLTAKLAEIRKVHGKIKKLEFFGHGNQATIFFQHKTVGETDLVGDVPKLKGIFTSDAKIVLNTCWTTRGEQGPHFLKALGENFLDEGGSVVGTEVTFGGTPTLIADLAAMPYLAFRGAWDAMDHRQQKPLTQYLTRPKILTVKVEPRPFEETKAMPSY